MPEIFIDGRALQARSDQTVMQVAREHGMAIPHLCWHPQLSVPGNCRICAVEVLAVGQAEGSGWIDIACNMPVAEGMRVLTDSARVRERRQQTMQFITLNHPVDCGICDKAGECLLQDYHYEHNGQASISSEPKVHATKHFKLSERIVLDNERCIMCTRCVRFTAEVSGSHALGVQQRGDHSLIRPVEDGAFERDAYSDNVIDLCPVGALLPRRRLHGSRVWFLQPTPSVCPGCARGCHIDIWHRKSGWQMRSPNVSALARSDAGIERVTPRDNPQGNGPWVCNHARDLADTFGRARATSPMLKGVAVPLAAALAVARALVTAARRPVALVSSAASNEELASFEARLASRFARFVKADRVAAPGEVVEDAWLIRADKSPNTAAARALGPLLPADARSAFSPTTDLVLVWGEGFDFTQRPPAAHVIFLNAWLQPEVAQADVFLPISTMLEQAGHFTNFQGVVSAFEACFEKPPGVEDATTLFGLLGAAP